MLQNKRNIHISIRVKNYSVLKTIAFINQVPSSKLIKEISLTNLDDSEDRFNLELEFNRAMKEVKIVGHILNSYSKQINANIKTRENIDKDFFLNLVPIIDKAYRIYEQIRLHDNAKFKTKFSFGDIKNHIKPRSPKKQFKNNNGWCYPRIVVSKSEYETLETESQEKEISLNKNINNKISVFQNQSTLHPKVHRNFCRQLVRSLKQIKNNANQIFYDKKENAFAIEMKIAKKIIQYVDGKLHNLKRDPILFNGKKFSDIHLFRSSIYEK
ncbi:hypothetical protein [Marinicella sp. W31]|uniref:hypothetical protein n=1 Tax=Marinicella sp. W31 TaxID=3023713 RepID=UPI00375830C1